MGNPVKKLGNIAGNIVGGVVDTVKDVASSDIGRLGLLAGGAYLANPALFSGVGGTAAATGTGLTAGSTGLGLTAGGTGLGLTGTAAGAGIGAGIGAGAAGSGISGLIGGLSTGQALGLGAGALSLAGGLKGSTPSSSTSTTAIDPDMKAAYLRNLEEARGVAGGLQAKQFANFSPTYSSAEDQLKNIGLGGLGMQTTESAINYADQLAGYTPQQIQAAQADYERMQAEQANRGNVQNVSGQIAADYMGKYQNPYETQVVESALSDVELARQRAGLTDRASATAAKAFGGSRQGVAEALTNEAALRNAATTAANLRSAGFTTALNAGQADAARQLQATMANQGVDLTLEQANAQLRQQAGLSNQGAANTASLQNAQLLQNARLANQQADLSGANLRLGATSLMGNLGNQYQNLGISGANAVLTAEAARQAQEQAKLDAARNLPLERLSLTQGALGLQPANLGGTQTTPIYKNQSASALGGALSGGILGNMIGGATGAGYGAAAGGLLGLLG